MNVLVVTPTYNERENLPLLAAGVLKHDGYRLLVVDDGSPDGTGAIADQLAAEHPGRVEVMHRTGRAVWAARTSTACCTPSPKAAPISSARWTATSRTIPTYLPSLVNAAAAHDLVIGSRYMNGGVSVVNWPIHRILLSAFGNRYIRFVTNLAASDCTSGYRCWRREALAQPADRRDGLRRLRVPRRDAVRSEAARVPDRRSADHLRRAPPRAVEAVVERADRVADHAVAPRVPRPLLTCATSS